MASDSKDDDSGCGCRAAGTARQRGWSWLVLGGLAAQEAAPRVPQQEKHGAGKLALILTHL
jgi:MYXO-CTERM domain-containing protein